MAWATSDRRSRLPRDWPARVSKVKRRAKGKCEAKRHHPRCDGSGSECDHVHPGDDHSLDNLQWLSEWCHKAKTSEDNAKIAAERAAMRKRPEEIHPGRIAP